MAPTDGASERKRQRPRKKVSVDVTMSHRERRSQLERSDAMKQRLIDATLDCLVQEGYAGTTISKIVERAGVSRGSPVHHFPSKAALIEATAEQLVRRIYIALGKMVRRVDRAEDRLQGLILAGWRDLLVKPEAAALLELLTASRHDPALATTIQKLWAVAFHTVKQAANHYLEPVADDDDVADLMILTQWVLRGMAEDRHVNAGSAQANRFFERYLDLWSELLATHLRAKDGVETPPPKPAFWDSSLGDI